MRCTGGSLRSCWIKIVAGEVPAVVVDQATAERWLFRLAGALMRLQERHRVDEHGQCSICWPVPRTWWRPWLRRATCTVHTALGFYLGQPERFVFPAIRPGPPVSVRSAS